MAGWDLTSPVHSGAAELESTVKQGKHCRTQTRQQPQRERKSWRMDIKDIKLTLKWCGKEFQITDLTDHDTVDMLKHEIFKKTQVNLCH